MRPITSKNLLPKLAAISLSSAMLLLLPKPARAGRVGNDIIALFPKNVGEFASAGLDPNSQVDELAWGMVAEGVSGKSEGTGSSAVPTGEEVIGVALGNF